MRRDSRHVTRESEPCRLRANRATRADSACLAAVTGELTHPGIRELGNRHGVEDMPAQFEGRSEAGAAGRF